MASRCLRPSPAVAAPLLLLPPLLLFWAPAPGLPSRPRLPHALAPSLLPPRAWARPTAVAGRPQLVPQAAAVAERVQLEVGLEEESEEDGGRQAKKPEEVDDPELARLAAQRLEELERLASEEDADAQYKMGRQFIKGRWVPKNLTRAFELLRDSADQGHIRAQYLAGMMLLKGQGIHSDVEEAFHYLTMAAEEGLAKAQYSVALLHHNGVGLEEKDLIGYAYWLRNAASGGHAEAQYRLGCMLLSGEELTRNLTWAAEYFALAGEQGHVKAQEAIGLMYRSGTGVGQDCGAAARWLGLAAEQGDAGACYALGCMHRVGEGGVPLDAALAVHWLTQAGDQGHVAAAEDLAVMHLIGEGTEPDEERATYWFARADHWIAEDEKDEDWDESPYVEHEKDE